MANRNAGYRITFIHGQIKDLFVPPRLRSISTQGGSVRIIISLSVLAFSFFVFSLFIKEEKLKSKDEIQNTYSAVNSPSLSKPAIVSALEKAKNPAESVFKSLHAVMPANEKESDPSNFQLGKLTINLPYLFEKDPELLARNPRVRTLLAEKAPIIPSDIQFPSGFRFSLQISAECQSLSNKILALETPDDQALKLLQAGHPAFVAARLQQNRSGDEIMGDLEQENCIALANADLLEETSAISVATEPLTSYAYNTANQILKNAGLLDLFSKISYSTFGNSTVSIAVIDTGVAINHPELRSISTGDVDDYGHGTMVAGTAAAPLNGIGAIGSMPFHTRIRSFKINIPGKISAYSSTISNGILRAAYEKVDVINVSWSGFTRGSYNSAIATAIAQNCFVVGAAGNYSQEIPQNLTSLGAVSVGALNGTTSSIASYSNYGAGVELYTPGTFLTTLKSGGYSLASGTSFASPLVAGLGLFVRAYAKNRGYKIAPATIENILRQTAIKIPTSRGYVPKLQPLAIFEYLKRVYP
jgi:subtilisin family serine protease